MVFLSVALPARYNRILNTGVGTFFTVFLMLITYIADLYFYKFFGVIETVLPAMVVWYAWTWPKAESAVQQFIMRRA